MDMTVSGIPAGSSIIDIDGLTRRFGDFIAVNAVSANIAKGEVFGLIGPNGAGKSTLIKMLATLLPPSSGMAHIAGFDIRRNAAQVRRHIGYVPQLLSADGSLTGIENMLLSSRLYGIPRHQQHQRIAQILDTMGLTEHAGNLVGHYSGGMIRRLEIAQSLLHRPDVLFLDEPTVGLDPAAREIVWEHVLQLRARYGATMVVSSHNMDEIDANCDRIAMIDRGRFIAVGTPAELKRRLGNDATLDDVFIALAGEGTDAERQKSYEDVRQARRAAREHG
ncbi:MAG: ATP-binding cassette domain-containing protein [Rhizobiales bacterium]|nr:ATP-binding cassette domain-containing protein [Hyphomicrobiales bacterium]MBI3673588.1 ATP-binding cassette domain-containing protein [Hyphomicrobiales bacterium]